MKGAYCSTLSRKEMCSNRPLKRKYHQHILERDTRSTTYTIESGKLVKAAPCLNPHSHNNLHSPNLPIRKTSKHIPTHYTRCKMCTTKSNKIIKSEKTSINHTSNPHPSPNHNYSPTPSSHPLNKPIQPSLPKKPPKKHSHIHIPFNPPNSPTSDNSPSDSTAIKPRTLSTHISLPTTVLDPQPNPSFKHTQACRHHHPSSDPANPS